MHGPLSVKNMLSSSYEWEKKMEAVDSNLQSASTIKISSVVMTCNDIKFMDCF